MTEKEWMTVYRYRGYDIKVLNGAEAEDEQGYKVDCWVLWANTYPTIEDATRDIDDVIDGGQKNESNM